MKCKSSAVGYTSSCVYTLAVCFHIRSGKYIHSHVYSVLQYQMNGRNGMGEMYQNKYSFLNL